MSAQQPSKNSSTAIMILLLITAFSHAASASETGVFKRNIALFEKVKNAQTLIDEYYGRGNNLSEAAVLLNEVVVEDKNYTPAYIEMARVVLKGGYIVNYEFRGGSLEFAYYLLNEAIKISPEYGDTYVLLGHVYSLAGQTPAATEALEKAASLGTDNPWLHNNSAYILYSQRRFPEAEAAYKIIMEKGHGDTSQQLNSYLDALDKLMNIAYQQSNDERLVQIAKIAVKVAHPNDAWVWGNAGGLLCREGFFDLGLEYNRRALSIMQYGVAKGNVAFCLYGKWAELAEVGKHNEADTHFNEAYQIYPDVRNVAEEFSSSGARL